MGRWKVSEQRNEVIKTALLEDQSVYTHVPQRLLLGGKFQISCTFSMFVDAEAASNVNDFTSFREPVWEAVA